ncbi:MAG TPA: hypothetical protein VHU81_07625 [Thermoanaerobaculia bacterium]|nr:hypothetical protein [Thermoanaerobaculia bacterium]
MSVARRMWRGMMVMAIAAGVVAPVSATTLVRASLEGLVKSNQTVIVGEVLDVNSHWNDEGSFILTDVKVSVADVLKGQVDTDELTVTVMGGRVGDLTTLIIGGPELIPGRAYVMFLNNESLPGTQALTVRDLCQGVFDIRNTTDGARAVSQANGHPLVPDSLGYIDAPGGVEGMPFNAMVRSIRDIAATQQIDNREVK